MIARSCRFEPGPGYKASEINQGFFFVFVYSGMGMYYTYAINSMNRNYIYVGISNAPDRRLKQHNQGHNKTTKPYAPFKRILLEEFKKRREARIREKSLKTGRGKAYLKTLV